MTITVQEVERAWRHQVHAADWYEYVASNGISNETIKVAWENVEKTTKHAVELQKKYSLQYKVQFCKHENAMISYRDIDGVVYYCPDCGGLLDENGDIVRMPLDEIPF